MSDISVVIPTYNYGHYIEQAIRSILNQTVLPKEIIVIDDGSTDNTETIISENYLTGEPHRIIYVKKSNGGAASARNLGIKKTKGEFILMLDADDQLAPHSIEIFTDQLKKTPWADMLVGGSLSVKTSGEKKHRPAPLLKKSSLDNGWV